MTREEIMERANDTYGKDRKEFLEKHDRATLERLISEGKLEEHLATVHSLVEGTIDSRCESIKKTAAYQNANALEQIRMLQTEQTFARQDAYRMYVCFLSEEEVEEEPNFSEGYEIYDDFGRRLDGLDDDE